MTDKQFADLIQRTERKIHVIELNVSVDLYRPLMRRFSDEFVSGGEHHDPAKKAVTSRFSTSDYARRNNVSIRWRGSAGRPYPQTLVVLRNPTKDFQMKLKGIIKSEISKIPDLRNKHPNEACCVFYVESPIDFFPKDVADLDRIFEYLGDGLCFNYGRSGEYTVFQGGEEGSDTNTHKCPTLYLGKRRRWRGQHGCVESQVYARNQLHGIRVYFRPIKKQPEYIRLEYTANKNRLIRMKLRGLDSLPYITPDSIRPLDYIQYRRKSRHSLHKYLMTKLHDDERPRSPLSIRTLMHIYKDSNWKGLPYAPKDQRVDSEAYKKWRAESKVRAFYDIIEIAASVDAYRELKTRYKLSYHVDRFYPKDEMKLNALKTLVYSAENDSNAVG